MKMREGFLLGLTALLAAAVLVLSGCQPPKSEPVRPVKIAEGEIDPAAWGKAYPVNYELWKKTSDPTPAGKSKYKRGYDADKITYDKLSEFPYMALLFNGWGFGVEYNEPRGHAYMMKDQIDIDSSRVGAGGVCLTCKTPYAVKLEKEKGLEYYSRPWSEVHAMIPEPHRELGVACVDCHDSKDMSLRISRGFTLGKALESLKVDPAKLTRQDMRSLVCAQCHVTYNIRKDGNMKSVGVYFPWQGSKWGDISVENVIRQIRSDPSVGEWKQKVTGFKLGFIRHPEFELFSANSVHWKAGVSCADCHMPYTRVGASKVTDHRVTSPLKNDSKACMQCHSETDEWLRGQVTAIQDRTASLMLRSGYATATAAKLFEMANDAEAAGKKIRECQGLLRRGLLPDLLRGGGKLRGLPQPDGGGEDPRGRDRLRGKGRRASPAGACDVRRRRADGREPRTGQVSRRQGQEETRFPESGGIQGSFRGPGEAPDGPAHEIAPPPQAGWAISPSLPCPTGKRPAASFSPG
jgi:nitrite reductase (cytochrome c-552)